MPDPTDLIPTDADREAARRYSEQLAEEYDDPAIRPLVVECRLAGVLAERRRAARVAIGAKQIGPATAANVAFGAACERIHDLILAGPHDPPS